MPKANNIAMQLFTEVLTRFEEAAIDRFRSLTREGSNIMVGVAEDERYQEKSKTLVDAFSEANNVFEEVAKLPKGHSVNFIHMPNGTWRVFRMVYEDGGRIIERYERNGRTLADAVDAEEVRIR